MITLRLVNRCDIQWLYDLLAERPDYANISHQEMPPWINHCEFVIHHPYAAWYIVELDNGDKVGTVYLTKHDEIGVQILNKWRGNGFGTIAINLITKLHPRERYLANISPKNDGSMRLFQRLGFKHIQNTYEFRP